MQSTGNIRLAVLSLALGITACSDATTSPGAGSGSNPGGAATTGNTTSAGGSVGHGGSATSSRLSQTGGTTTTMSVTSAGGRSGVGTASTVTAGGTGSSFTSATGGVVGTVGSTIGGKSGVGGTTKGGAGGKSGVGGTTKGGAGGTGGKSSTSGNAGAGGVEQRGTGGASTGTYRPCPTNGDACRILPLGDSITWGLQYDGAYRVQLFTKAVAAQQKITFTGSVSNGPTTVSSVAFPRSNEGHSGWTIAQITDLVPSPAFNTIPHIVLLMIGTNDIYAASGQAAMPQRLGALLDKVIAAAPDALLVVAKITPLATASWNATIKTYNDAIPALVQTRVAAGKHVMLADMNTGFTSAMLSSDSVHPNKSGYDFMGNQWYSLIGDLLPK